MAKTPPPKPERAHRPARRGSPSLEDEARDANLDRTIEDTFPASDPPSSIPDPADQPDPGDRDRDST